MTRTGRGTKWASVVVVAVLAWMYAGLAVSGPAYAVAPTISSFTPTAAKLHATITITGTNFTAPATVSFNGVTASTTTVVSSTTITSVIPASASSGPIRVSTPGGTVTSTQSLTVVPSVVVSPASGPPGATRTVFFSGFGASEGADIYFDTTSVTLGVTSSSGAANVAITIPATTSPGTHWITVIGRRSGYSAQAAFEVRSNWAQYGHGAAHQNASPDTTITAENVDDLDVAWRTPAYGFSDSTPAIVDGVVYQGFGDSTVRAFDEKTGALKWTQSVDGHVNSSPAVVGGSVYVGDDNGTMYSLKTTTGAVSWTYSIGAGVPLKSSPAVTAGVVYFGGDDAKVHALNAGTGAPIWVAAAAGKIYGSPAVAAGFVYVATESGPQGYGVVQAFNVTGGGVAWQANANYNNDAFYASPMVAGGRVFVADKWGEYLLGLRATTGHEDWKKFVSFGSYAGAAYANKIVYQPTPGGQFYGFTPGAGTQAMRANFDITLQEGGALTVANGVGFYSAPQATYMVRLSDGDVLGTLLGSTSYGGPTIINGAVTLIDSSDGSLVHYTLGGVDTPAVVARPNPAKLQRVAK